jgi:hypothetical protein
VISRSAVASASIIALAIVIVASAPAHADETTATVAYRQAEELAKKGNFTDACPLYEASYKADPQIGVLLHLADCHEKIGRTATAWAEFQDAVELSQRHNDTRAAYAQSRVDALAPKLARVRIARPAKAIPGLVVKRDGTDITILVGTDMAIDPGEHEIVVSAPGFTEARKKLKIEAGAKTTPFELPALQAEVQKPVETGKPVESEAKDGSLAISTQPDAEIRLDSDRVGTGRYEGKVKPGRHTLRVSAPGMRAYQTEIVVLDGEHRSIDVPALERDASGVVSEPSGPGWELGFGIAPGVKSHGDSPGMLALRLDLAKRIGRRVRFGIYGDYAMISTGGSCGTDLPGPNPATPIDFGPHDQFQGCKQYTVGLELIVHILPDKKIDPWIAYSPGFRILWVNLQQFDSAGVQMPNGLTSQQMIGIAIVPVRAGADYRISKKISVGAFFEGQYWLAQEYPDHLNNGGGHNGPDFYMSFFGGVRSSLAF